MTVQYCQVGDIRIAYRWDGRAKDDATAPLLMMAHAMGTSHQIWDSQIPALADRYRILRYDWRGHGQTDAPAGPYTLPQFEADAVGLMDALGIERVNWVGISTGGMIGQGLGINYPDRIASLALCNTTSMANPWYKNWVAERQAVVKESGMSPVWEMTHKLWFTDAFAQSKSADYEHIRKIFVRTPVPGYLGGTSAVAELSYLPNLKKVKVPTVVIAAGDDPVTPVDHSEAIHNAIAGSTLVVIDGQRHFSNVEDPTRFNQPLVQFLDGLSD
jgi:3-oxoadipate enol-lactonase